MRNGLGRAASENAELAFSDGFAATDETDFKLIRYMHNIVIAGLTRNPMKFGKAEGIPR